jgi:DNA polymerase
MGWTERQQAMLQAMGLRVWTPPAPGEEAADATATDKAIQAARTAPERRQPAGGDPALSSGRSAAVSQEHAADPSSVLAEGEFQDRAPSPSARRSSDALTVTAPDARSGAAPGLPPGLAPAHAPDPAPHPPSLQRTDRTPGASAADLPAPPETPISPVSAVDLDWPALREAVAGCRACALCDSRRQTVFGVGHPQAHWMVIGEAPGEQEDRRGEPFVGPAGQLLDRMLAALDLTREAEGADPARQVYITNTLKCRPPANRNPAPDELARCEPFLRRQIELVQPRIILAMGRFAVQALLRTDEAIGRLRGRVHHYQGVPLIVTYHPAYLLRNLPHKARAWDDLCLAAATAERDASTPSD